MNGDNAILTRACLVAALGAALMSGTALAQSAFSTDDDAPAKPAWGTDAKTGCKVWNPNPQPGETLSWNGTCKNGMAEGRGFVQWFRDGMPYERSDGQWRDGKQIGQGVHVWPEGRYEGGFLSSDPEGRGLLVLNDVRYQGEFHGGLPDGTGVLKSSDGVFQGVWKRGCFNDGKRRTAVGVPIASCR